MGGGEEEIKNKEITAITIYFDPTSKTTVKAAQVLESMLREYFEVKWEEIEEKESLAQKVEQQQKRTAILYVFHGTPKGMTTGMERIGWEEVTQIVESSNSKYHLFLSCYSEGKITTTSKMVQGQKGEIDYSLAVIGTIHTIGAMGCRRMSIPSIIVITFTFISFTL